MILVLLGFFVLFLAFSNGANDNFKGVATIYGSGIASYRTALAWATFMTLAGSVASLFIAEGLLQKFSGKGLVPDAAAMSEHFLLAVMIAASTTVMLATRLGFPISTTHALLGGLVGAGSVGVGPWSLNFSALGKSFVMPLLISPLLALALCSALAGLFYLAREPAHRLGQWCLCLVPGATGRAVIQRTAGVVYAGPGAPDAREVAFAVAPEAMFGGSGSPVQGAKAVSTVPCVSFSGNCEAAGPCIEVCKDPGPDAVASVRANRLLDAAHFVTAGTVSFARGLNDTGKIAAPLLLIEALSPVQRIVLVAIAIAVGGVRDARCVAETMSRKITRMNSGEGFAANLTTSALVTLASFFALPVSTTHVSVGSLLGIGFVTGKANPRTVVAVLLSWIVTLPCAAFIGVLAYVLLGAVR